MLLFDYLNLLSLLEEYQKQIRNTIKFTISKAIEIFEYEKNNKEY